MLKIVNILNYNKVKYVLLYLFVILLYIYFENILQPTILNEDNINIIIKIIKKFLNLNNKPILSINEQLISNYWNEKPLCLFSKLISHGLTKEEALLIIDFFKIENIEDLVKLKLFINNIKK